MACSFYQGFTVSQPVPGDLLEFVPAKGTQELDQLINAYIPGPMPIQEKRARVTIDFYEWSRLTGLTAKYYQVTTSPTSSLIDSPTGSAAFDSGYGSNIEPSPVLSSWESPASFRSAASVSAPAAVPSASLLSGDLQPSSSQRRSRQPGASSRLNHRFADFSDMPGMKIVTRDGRDVTNSTSRASKTKEQRDHTHLMRILKACPDCRRRKARCDPSHRTRPRAQAAAAESRIAAAVSRTRERTPALSTQEQLQTPPLPLELTLEPSALTADELSLLQFDLDVPGDFLGNGSFPDPGPFLGSFTGHEDFLNVPFDSFGDATVLPNPLHHLHHPEAQTPAVTGLADTSIAPVLASMPPTASVAWPSTINASEYFVAAPVATAPALPFELDVPGADYIDFNLYSPASDTLEDDVDFQMIGARGSVLSRGSDSQRVPSPPPPSLPPPPVSRQESTRQSPLQANVAVVESPGARRSHMPNARLEGDVLAGAAGAMLRTTPGVILLRTPVPRLRSLTPNLFDPMPALSNHQASTNGSRAPLGMPSSPPIPFDNDGYASMLASPGVRDLVSEKQPGVIMPTSSHSGRFRTTTTGSGTTQVISSGHADTTTVDTNLPANGQIYQNDVLRPRPLGEVGRTWLARRAPLMPQLVSPSNKVSRHGYHTVAPSRAVPRHGSEAGHEQHDLEGSTGNQHLKGLRGPISQSCQAEDCGRLTSPQPRPDMKTNESLAKRGSAVHQPTAEMPHMNLARISHDLPAEQRSIKAAQDAATTDRPTVGAIGFLSCVFGTIAALLLQSAAALSLGAFMEEEKESSGRLRRKSGDGMIRTACVPTPPCSSSKVGGLRGRSSWGWSTLMPLPLSMGISCR